MLVAFVTVYEDPIIGILFGVAISLFIFLQNISQGHFEVAINDAKKRMVGQASSKEKYSMHKDSHTIVYSIKGHLSYIDSQSHMARFEAGHTYHKNIILRLRELYFIDLDGVDALEEIIEMLENRGVNVYITGANAFIINMLSHSKYFAKLKKEGRVQDHTSDVLKKLGFKI